MLQTNQDNNKNSVDTHSNKGPLIMLIVYILLVVAGNYLLPLKMSQVLNSIGDYSFIIMWAVILVKMLVVDRFLIGSSPVYYLSKVIDVILISSLMIRDGNSAISVLLIAMVVYSSLLKGSEGARNSGLLSLISYIEIIVLSTTNNKIELKGSLGMHLLNIAVIAAATFISYKFALKKDSEIRDKEKALTDLTVSNSQLQTEIAEIKCQLTDMDFRNQKANKNLAELKTYQHVSKVMSSTLNIKELLNLVNDMIIGILGVKYCSIFLKNQETGNLTVGGSNIKNEALLEQLKDKVATKTLELIERGHGVLGNAIDPYNYPGGIERQVQSADYVPIVKQGKILGLIIAEHAIERGLDDSTKKFIETIANQIAVAIENAMLYDQMEQMATIDALTRVNNRMYFQENYKLEFEKAKNGNYPLCAAMLDIDHFKRFNDTYGHDFGDEVLRSTAQTVKKNLDANGMVARYGGEEFIILFRGADLETGFAKADELRRLIEANIIKHNDKAVRVTVSMGVSEFPRIASNEKDLLKTADEALYKSKENGRNQVSRGEKLN